MIYGNRIRFRAPEREDLPRFVAWLNDPEVRAGLLMYLPLSMAQEEEWFKGMLARPPEEQVLVIEVREGDGWLAIGSCDFNHIHLPSRSAMVGIMIGEKRFWNQGYGTEAMQLLLKHGFETLNLNRIGLEVFDTNLRAIRCYEKAGFVHEGCHRQAMFKDGKYMDILQMSVLRSEWENRG